MTRTPLSLALSAGAVLAVLLLGACASEPGIRVDDIVRIPLGAPSTTAPSAPAADEPVGPDGPERIRREEALRRDLAAGRASDESRDRCSPNGWIEGC